MPQHVTVFEHQVLTVGSSEVDEVLSDSEAEELARIGERRPGFCQRGYRSLRFGHYCGIVAVGHRVFEVLPKVDPNDSPEECRGLLLNLLRESPAFPVFRHLEVAHHLCRQPLLELFISMFFDEVVTVVRGGLLRQYQEREEDLSVVRGRVAVNRQFAVLSNRPDRVACIYDDLTADNFLNRFLKSALRVVRPWISSLDLDRRWVELINVFDEVQDVSMGPQSVRGLPLDRHAFRYKNAIIWARWILELLMPRLRAGTETAPGLLFDMNLLFQAAVASVFRRQFEGIPNITVTTQDTGAYLATISGKAARRLPLRPDIVIRKSGQVISIVDSKWKRLEVVRQREARPSEADAYQMVAYASGYTCGHLMLVYPWYRGLNASLLAVYELPPVTSTATRLELAFVDVLRQPLKLVTADGVAVHL